MDKIMPLEVSEKPDTIIRVMMDLKGLNEYRKVKEQKITKVERKGFTVVEWGGTIQEQKNKKLFSKTVDKK